MGLTARKKISKTILFQLGIHCPICLPSTIATFCIILLQSSLVLKTEVLLTLPQNHEYQDNKTVCRTVLREYRNEVICTGLEQGKGVKESHLSK